MKHSISLPKILIPIAIAGALLLSACGGSNDNQATAASSTSGGQTVGVSTINGSQVLVNSSGNALYSPDEEAVALGLQRTGRIVTFAAALMVIAIGCFVTASIIFIKQLGFGVAVAVLIDATIVRALLVPALMRLLGDWNWWVPRPLARLLPA